MKLFFKALLIFFILINVVIAFHAWNFTHYTIQDTQIPQLGKMSTGEKLKAMLGGVQLPKLSFDESQYAQYKQIKLGDDSAIAAWLQVHDSSK
jgi:uncharacterized protein